jgi:hypothetical protein
MHTHILANPTASSEQLKLLLNIYWLPGITSERTATFTVSAIRKQLSGHFQVSMARIAMPNVHMYHDDQDAIISQSVIYYTFIISIEGSTKLLDAEFVTK